MTIAQTKATGYRNRRFLRERTDWSIALSRTQRCEKERGMNGRKKK